MGSVYAGTPFDFFERACLACFLGEQSCPWTPRKEDAVLVFTEVDVSAKKAFIKLRYDVEGIKASTSLQKGEYGWEIVNSRVVER